MTDTMIRSVPEQQHQRIQEIARQRNLSQNDVYLQAIAAYLESQSPQLNLGWIEVDRYGDLDGSEECPDCHQDLNAPIFVALMADGSHYGPVCQWCATSE